MVPKHVHSVFRRTLTNEGARPETVIYSQQSRGLGGWLRSDAQLAIQRRAIVTNRQS